MEGQASCPDGKILPLPDEFVEFLNENGLDPSIYVANDSTPRYIRLKPGFEAHIEEFESEINCKIERLSWLPNFYCLPPDIRIASSKAYQEGKIYGIDAASGAAVSSLDITSGDHVLDLCAAPGAKLCMILDLLGSSGSVTGVDIAQHRLAACRTMLQKYALGDRCRLFVADGTTFSLLPLRLNQPNLHLKESQRFTRSGHLGDHGKKEKRHLKQEKMVLISYFHKLKIQSLYIMGGILGLLD